MNHNGGGYNDVLNPHKMHSIEHDFMMDEIGRRATLDEYTDYILPKQIIQSCPED